MTLPRVRAIAAVVFVGGIAGMIVGSIADDNAIAVTFGILTSVAALCLLLATSMQQAPVVHFDEQQASDLERRIGRLVDQGAAEDDVRDLVRRAVRLGRDARTDGAAASSRTHQSA
jgi:hypothetical protein